MPRKALIDPLDGRMSGQSSSRTLLRSIYMQKRGSLPFKVMIMQMLKVMITGRRRFAYDYLTQTQIVLE